MYHKYLQHLPKHLEKNVNLRKIITQHTNHYALANLAKHVVYFAYMIC